MTWAECIQRVRAILAEVDQENEIGLVEHLGDLEYGVLEKTLSSEIARFIADEFGLDPDPERGRP